MSSVGLLGGTFDPVHQGHLDVAGAARQALDLTEVWFVPSRQPPHRARPIASPAHRFAMVALAIAGEEGMRVSDIEMEGAGPSFTIDTLERLETRQPSMAGSVVIIVGADALLAIATWHRSQELLDRVHFAAVSRPGHPVSTLRTQLPGLASRMRDTPCTPTHSPSIFLVEADTAPVSSTAVRSAIAAGAPLAQLLPAAVADYAIRHGLYSDPAGLESSRG